MNEQSARKDEFQKKKKISELFKISNQQNSVANGFPPVQASLYKKVYGSVPHAQRQ